VKQEPKPEPPPVAAPPVQVAPVASSAQPAIATSSVDSLPDAKAGKKGVKAFKKKK